MEQANLAGAVVVDLRRRKPKYLVVHRKADDKWMLVQGPTMPNELPLETAVREVAEQTGFACDVVGTLDGHVSKDGVARRFWMLQPTDGAFRRNEVVDAVVWMKRSDAMALLSSVRDQRMLAEAHLTLSDRPTIAVVDDTATTRVTALVG